MVVDLVGLRWAQKDRLLGWFEVWVWEVGLHDPASPDMFYGAVSSLLRCAARSKVWARYAVDAEPMSSTSRGLANLRSSRPR